MIIETKYNIGDEVWVAALNKYPVYQRITKITILKGGVIMYSFINIGDREEKYLFPTKEELLKSL